MGFSFSQHTISAAALCGVEKPHSLPLALEKLSLSRIIGRKGLFVK